MAHTLKIAVANLQSGIGTTRGHLEYLSSAWKYVLPGNADFILKAASVLKDELVDISLLTEVNEISFRSNNRSQIKILEEILTPIESRFFPTIKTKKHLHEGNAIISKYPIKEARTHQLPSLGISRVIGESTIMIEGTLVSVFVTHLSLSSSQRYKQLVHLARIISERSGPLILGGDFNERDVSILQPLLGVGFSSLHYEKNFPSWKPTHSLDYLFLSEHFTDTRCYIPNTKPFSDHAPLIVETTLQ